MDARRLLCVDSRSHARPQAPHLVDWRWRPTGVCAPGYDRPLFERPADRISLAWRRDHNLCVPDPGRAGARSLSIGRCGTAQNRQPDLESEAMAREPRRSRSGRDDRSDSDRLGMFEHLQIYEPRERLLVGLADGLLRAGAGLVGLWTHADSGGLPRRVLLL